MLRSKQLSGLVVCFGRIDEPLSSSGLYSLRPTPVSIHRCDVCYAVARFCLTFWPAPLTLDSISTENWVGAVDDATSECIGQSARSTFLPHGIAAGPTDVVVLVPELRAGQDGRSWPGREKVSPAVRKMNDSVKS